MEERHLSMAQAGLGLGRWVACAAAVVGGMIGLAGCGGKKSADQAGDGMTPVRTPAALVGELSRQLAASRVASARERLRVHAPDEALAWVAAALAADRETAEAAGLVRELLSTVRWPVTGWELAHGLRVERLAVGEPGVLFVALAADGDGGDFRTVVRWDTRHLRLDAVMFPIRGGSVNELWAAPRGPALVVARGTGGSQTRLLCAADSLRPVAELGPLPAGLTPEAVTATPPNGLLFGGPEQDPDDPERMIWRIRDAMSGDLVRSSDPVGPETPPPVAAWMDATALRVLLRDGSLAVVPVSPVEPAVRHRPPQTENIAQARFANDGHDILGLWEPGGGRAPQRRVASLELNDGAGDGSGLAWNILPGPPDPWWWETPWSRYPNWWDSLLRDHGDPDDPPAVRLEGQALFFADGSRAPVRETGELAALAFQDGMVITARRDGMVRGVEWLPPAELTAEVPNTEPPTDPGTLIKVAAALSGFRYDETTGALTTVSADERRELLAAIPADAVAELLPGLDLRRTWEAARREPRTPPHAAWLPLWERLAQADASGRSWPRWLELGQFLGDSRWHQDLSEELKLRQAENDAIMPDDAGHDDSPWRACRQMRMAAAADDDAAFEAALTAAGGTGPALAAALALALDGRNPARIAACLAAAGDAMPPLLRVLGASRIALLEGRPADALALWPDEFPDWDKVRTVQDWHGWEQEDFASRYRAHIDELSGEFAQYDVARAGTPEERRDAAAKLLEPGARQVLGRRRLADLCLKGALALATGEGPQETVRALAKRARDAGADPAPCLRAEALACNHLKHFEEALPLWVELLTEHPPASHLASDYAEAAYTAFEVHNPRQAMEILTTGVRRFGHDPDFALQAGWISLLTGNHGRAYQFLLAGWRVGYAAEVRENALLLLSVAASLSGFPQDAAAHYFALLEQDAVWEDPATVDELDWPEELKTALRALVTGQGFGGEPDVMLPGDAQVLPDL